MVTDKERQTSMNRFHCRHPDEWIDELEAPGVVWVDGRPIERVPSDTKPTRYFVLDDEDYARRWEIPPIFVDGMELTPGQVGDMLEQLEQWTELEVRRAFQDGVRTGRDQIRGILRDLVGPETAQNVSCDRELPL